LAFESHHAPQQSGKIAKIESRSRFFGADIKSATILPIRVSAPSTRLRKAAAFAEQNESGRRGEACLQSRQMLAKQACALRQVDPGRR
jgi:hypothetical protein